MTVCEPDAPANRTNAGQPPTDIVWRLRNWVWYCQIKKATQLSDDALDAKYLSDTTAASGARRRLFQRIRGVGSNPTQPRVDLLNQSVFDRVHSESSPALDAAAQNFRSPLWHMLAERGYAQREFANIIEGLVAARGWYRASTEDFALAEYFFQDDPAFGGRSDRENVYSSMLTSLESSPSANNIALIGALFREALEAVDLKLAEVLRSSLMGCTALWMAKIGWWDTNDPYLEDEDGHWFRHGPVFEYLVSQRLVRNVWTEPSIDRSACGNQWQFVQALLRAHARPPYTEKPGPSARPIVLRSPRVQWLQQNHEVLSKVRHELAWADSHEQLRGSMDPKLRQYGEECVEYGNKLRVQLHPPERDTRYCLPVRPNRGSRRGDRPAPYLIDGTLDAVTGPSAKSPEEYAAMRIAAITESDAWDCI
jgi:hypothetical protein